MKQYSSVQVASEEPTNENVNIWINDNSKESYTLPEIKNNEISNVDTCSSQKIYDELRALRALREWFSNQLSNWQ